nr:hypothetical protein [Tanacetum cinerariifolium]
LKPYGSFLAFASYMGFIVYQMNVKSAFLYDTIDKEVYVSQPPGFVDSKFPNKVYKVVKALYGLHEVPRASVKTASISIETQKPLVKDEVVDDVDVHLYRFQVTPKTSHLHAVNRIFRFLKGQPKLGLWYLKVSSFDLEDYSDSDYTSINLDKKSKTGGCQFLGDKIERNIGFKTCEKPVSQVEQVFLEELEKLKRQEKEANDAAKSLRKEATHDIQNASTSNTNLINTASTPLSNAGPSRLFNDGELSYPDPFKYALPDDPSMPHLEDIYARPNEGIFTDSSYDDEGVKAIGTKWVYKKKKDERGVVVRNKARLVAQGHRQEEGIDYVESAFLYGTIDKEVYLSQPPSFVDPKFPNKVYKVVKALYGLHQALRACTSIETQKPLVKDEVVADVDVHLYRFQVTPKTSHLHAVKRIFRYLKGQQKLGLKYLKVSSFDLEAYSDSDYASTNLDKKSITGANDDQGANLKETNLNEEHFVLLIWSAYSTIIKSSGDKIERNIGFKTYEKPVSQVEQVFLEELEKLKRQEKKANDAAESLRKEA